MQTLDVKVETFIATAAADPEKEVRPKLWRVRVNKMHAGFIHWKPGSKLLMHLRFSPEEMRFIEAEVSRQIAAMTGTSEVPVGSVMPAEVPAEWNNKTEEGFSDDDFDA